MLDICLLGTGGMMPLPYRWLTSMMARCQGEQSSDRLWGGNPDRFKRKGMESEAY